ncbi:MAG: DUF424 family protein [archaeon]
MYMKVMRADRKVIVAVCDCDCIDKVFEDDETGRILDLKAHASFYRGERATPEQVRVRLRDADSINLVGEKAVAIGIELGLVKPEGVFRICGVPHAQAYLAE